MGLLTYRMVAPETYYRSTACIETYHGRREHATDFGSVALSDYALQTMTYGSNQGGAQKSKISLKAPKVPGFEMAPWVGIVAPARTPKEIVERLSKETLAIMHDPQVVKQLIEQQVTPFALTPDRFSELISKDLEKWAGVIKTAGIKGE